MKRIEFLLKRASLSLTLGLALVTCSPLEEETYGVATADNFFENEAAFVSVMLTAYGGLFDYPRNSSMFGLQEVSSDEMTVPTRGDEWFDGGHWVRLHRGEWTPDDPTFSDTWRFLYNGVHTCNRTIFLLEEIQNPRATPYIQEVRALRAIYYLWLLDVFGNVPIITDFAETEPPPTRDRSEVFAFVEKELLAVLEEVPMATDQTTYGRINKYKVHMTLARLYLNAEVYTGQAAWAEASSQAEAIIRSGAYSLEADYFANFAVDNSTSSEIIWAIPFDQSAGSGFNLNMMTLHPLSQETYHLQSQPWNGFCTVQDFFNTYEEKDLRKGAPGTEAGPSHTRGNFLWGAQWDASGTRRLVDSIYPASLEDPDGPPLTFRPQLNALYPDAWPEAGARIGKFEFEIGGTENMNNDFPLFRYAEALLIRAEALWRQDPASLEALNLVNQIRSRAGVAPFSALSAEHLLAERGRELFAETVRRTDQIRFGQWTAVWWERPEQAAYKTLFPIPTSGGWDNPFLRQNPGY